jgi:hypothetical protein
MKNLKLFNEFLINEDYKYNQYLVSLPSWTEFLNKFSNFRNQTRKGIDPTFSKYNRGDFYSDKKPEARFIDEMDLENIHRDWVNGYQTPVEWGKGSESAKKLMFEGLNNPEIGDILVTFRETAWLFKPDSNFNYRYSSSAVWAHSGSSRSSNSSIDLKNEWDDIKYLDEMLRGYVFSFRKEEIPLIFREKLARSTRPSIFDKNTGYRRREKMNSPTSGGKIQGYFF